jgi:MFS family permease
MSIPLTKPRNMFMDMTTYQWLVLLAAWIGWGFDVFDGLLFNYVAPNCIPTLLHLAPASIEARKATLLWTGIVTSALLVGWAIGGIIFGRVADRIGRSKTLLITILLYSIGTALCALAPNIWVLLVCRIIASFGIGGEWAAGASMVAEVVPNKRRIEAGALLYTSAPIGLFLATFVNHLVAGQLYKADPSYSWRVVFLVGLLPAAFAFVLRLFIKEPDRWSAVKEKVSPKLSELFAPDIVKRTVSGLIPSLTVLISWWSFNAFTQLVATFLAVNHAKELKLDVVDATALKEGWKTIASNWFNWGGLIGTVLTIPAAKYLGRRPMFGIYFVLSALTIFAGFGLKWSPMMQLFMFFPIGISIFGIFGSFTFYLPELFPTRLRCAMLVGLAISMRLSERLADACLFQSEQAWHSR